MFVILQVGDEVVIDGGMVRLEVVEISGPDAHCRCIDPGLILSLQPYFQEDGMPSARAECLLVSHHSKGDTAFEMGC